MTRLTHKQRAFVSEYLKDFNATVAARRAGYSPKTASSIGHENLKNLRLLRRLRRSSRPTP